MDFSALMALFGGSPQMGMQPNMPSAQLPTSMPGLSSPDMSQMGGHSFGQKLGGAMGGNWSQPTGGGLSAYNPAPAAHSQGLAALLQQLGLM